MISQMSNTITKKQRDTILRRDKCQCVKCSCKSNLVVHHIISITNGGTHQNDNLIMLCYPCHEEWHAITCISAIPFSEWVTIPPYNLLLALYRLSQKQDIATTITLSKASDLVKEFQRTLLEIRDFEEGQSRPRGK